MTNHVGQATTCAYILPNTKALARTRSVKLSPEAKFRLRFIDNYCRYTRNVTTTCRLFGITRSLFYKWYSRFNPSDLTTLESRSSRPHRLRSVSYGADLVGRIRSYRQGKDTATYSAKKLATVIQRDYSACHSWQVSAATIGRIIKKYQLFFQQVVRVASARSKRAIEVWKTRKPAGLQSILATAPRRLIEFDMKHVYAGGHKYYAFCAIDVYSREVVIHVATSATSRQAMIALAKAHQVFGDSIAILNDNGSENLGKAYAYLKRHGITQYFARPYTPKDKPYVERLIGSYQRECLDQYRMDITSLQELDYYTARWLNIYHYFRPHNSLKDQTPAQFCAKLNLTIAHRKVSTR
jgi:transposase InsO family protein